MVNGENDSKTLRIKFSDPEHFIPSDENGEANIIKWSHTILIKKVGSYPINEEDGVVIIDNYEQDYYNNHYLPDSCTSEEMESGVYYKLWSVYENGKKCTTDELQFCIDSNTNVLDWDNISRLVQSGEAQTFGGLEIGGFLFTPHSVYGCPNTDDTTNKKQGQMTLRIVGFDFENVNYEGNPNGSPLHSMTLWSEHVCSVKYFSPSEKPYALTEDTVFHKEYEIELITTIDGQSVRDTKTVANGDYIPFFIYDKTQTGFNRVWRSYYGSHKIAFNQTSQRWELVQLYNGKVVVSSKDNILEPFDDREIADDTISIENPESLKWEMTESGKYVIVNRIKKYYTYDGTSYSADDTIINGEEITPETYYEINPDLNGARASNTGTIAKPYTFTRSNRGNNCWSSSSIKQYLNTDKGANLWFKKGNLWSNSPSYANEDGFLKGFTDTKFLSHLATVKNYTERGYCSHGGGYDITYDKVSLPSRSNMTMFDGGIGNYSYGINGEYEINAETHMYLPYLREKFIPKDESEGKTDAYLKSLRKKILYNSNAVKAYWLREPRVSNSSYVWQITTTGEAYYGDNATSLYNGVAPLFTII